MTTNKIFTLALLASLWAGVAQAMPAQSLEPAATLNQAVLQVHQNTGGKVLSAEPHEINHKIRYFIKVLTPDGHVQKLIVPSETNKSPAAGQPTKNLPGKRPGSKEKH